MSSYSFLLSLKPGWRASEGWARAARPGDREGMGQTRGLGLVFSKEKGIRDSWVGPGAGGRVGK